MRGSLLLVALAACTSAGSLSSSPPPDGDRYAIRTVEGWTVHVARPLLDDNSEVGRKALRVLEMKLFEITRLVPAKAVGELQKVPIWLCAGEGTKGGGNAEYHPSESWLREHGYNPVKAKAVEIGDAAKFLEFSIPQPMVLLHEMAHAYHDRVLGFDHPGILSAYKAAVDGKKYERVLHVGGKTARHYALTNEKEYFAEASEAWFGTNDFYPFVRAELREFDPQGAKVLDEVWGR